MNETIRSKKELFDSIPPFSGGVEESLAEARQGFDRKIVVLDDDPTGIQTVHDVSVYTDWEPESLLQAFEEETSMFFILTNSRGFTQSETIAMHTQIAENILWAAKKTGKKFVVISRGDSTLRGHYPLEPQVLRKVIESDSEICYDGEILMPFFAEGGRFTAGDVHYVAYGDELVPAGQTEFAKDKTFGYTASNLKEYIEEKSGGKTSSKDVVSVSLEELRRCDVAGIRKKLCGLSNCTKVIVNAICYDDVKVFAAALMLAIKDGKEFLFRTAAALPKILGNVSDQPLLERGQLVDAGNPNGGIIVVGSHVSKTTKQLEMLHQASGIEFIEMNQHLVVDEEKFEAEKQRVNEEVQRVLTSGKTAAVYTRRDRFDLNNGNKEDELKMAVKISDAVTGVVASLKVKPRFIIAKGGITSSDVGVKALQVKKALVLGQILPGIPVWKTGDESKFPGTSYVIFPGNVGDDDALLRAVEKMQT